MRIRSVVTHSAQAIAEGALISLLVVGLLAGTSLAAKPAGGGSGGDAAWISLAASTGSAAVQPSLGSTVTFAAGYPKNVNNPRVEVLCYQSTDPSGLALYDPARGYLVYGETGDIGQALGDGTSPLGYNGFQLGGGMSAWLLNGGSASCIANLFYFGQHAGVQTYNVLATTGFAAS
jgi:hypothetical protein